MFKIFSISKNCVPLKTVSLQIIRMLTIKYKINATLNFQNKNSIFSIGSFNYNLKNKKIDHLSFARVVTIFHFISLLRN